MSGIRLVLPAASGAGLFAFCLLIARTPNLVEAPVRFLLLATGAFACYVVGILCLRGAANRAALGLILIVAAACRAALLPAPPTLSTDAYRYVWDARVAAAGISPYRFPPVAPELVALRDSEIFPRLNHATWRTIYPPAAQLFFRTVYAVAPDSIMAMKIAMGLAEVVAALVLMTLLRALDLPATRLAIYAWNPLVLVELWGTAHLDAIVLALVMATALAVVKGARAVAAILLGVAALVKLYPVVLLPLVLRRREWKPAALFAATFAVGYLPLVGLGREALGSLPRYLTEMNFNPGLARSIVDAPFVTALALGGWVAWAATRAGSLATRAVPLIGGSVVLAPNVFPWYAVWMVPFLAVTPSMAWIALTGTLPFAYAFFLSAPWAIPTWARVIEVSPLVVAAAITLLRRFHIPVTFWASRVLRFWHQAVSAER